MPVRRSRLHHALAALLCLAGGGVLLTTWGCEAGGDGAADAAADAHAEVSLDAAADAQVGDTGPQDSGDAEDAPSDLAGGGDDAHGWRGRHASDDAPTHDPGRPRRRL